MDKFTREDLDRLANARYDHCVSITMPAHRAGRDTRPASPEDLIRWKNLVKEAERKLEARGASADAIMKPAHRLLDDGEFWRHQGDGLAVFAAPDHFETYRVPRTLEKLVVVASRFHITPLLPLLGGGRFYILAFGQNHVRLIEAGRDEAKEVSVDAMPTSLSEALRFDDPEKQLQFHTATAPATGSGTRAAAYHGHGVGIDDTKDNILRFSQQVDAALVPFLRENGNPPLVIAAVESTASIYRQANHYPNLIEQPLAGNYEHDSAAELREKARPLVEPALGAARERDRERYSSLKGNHRTLTDLDQTLRAAVDGRVDVLFLAEGKHTWGTFDESKRRSSIHAEPKNGDHDLLDLAATYTFLNGGTVHTLRGDEMPEETPMAALLRY